MRRAMLLLTAATWVLLPVSGNAADCDQAQQAQTVQELKGAIDDAKSTDLLDILPELRADVEDTDSVVFVILTAKWCDAPCKILEATLAKVAERCDIEVVKVDIEEIDKSANQALQDQYNMRGLPDVTMFEGGESIHRFLGAQSDSKLEEMIDGYASAGVCKPIKTLK